MKFRIALVAVLVVGLTASLAIAAPAKGPKAKAGATTTTTAKAKKACRPKVSLILKGKLVAVADDQLSFTIDVTQTSRHAKLYKGQTITVQVSAKAKISRLGEKVALNTLTVGDRLVVQTRICKKSADATVAPLAVRVVARPATSNVCRPRVALVLRGTLAAIADDQLSFTLNVTQTNRHAKAYKGKTVSVQVNAKTKIRRLGAKVTLSALTIGDRLNVQARACKTSAGEAASPLAVRVVAKPAKPAPTTTTTT